MKVRTVVAGLGLVLVAGFAAAASGSREVMDIQARAYALFKGQAKANGVHTTFTEVAIANSAGVEVAGMGSDSAGEGIIGVGNRAGDPRMIALVSAAGAGQVAVMNAAGRVSYILDGAGGLLAATGDLAETFPVADKAMPGSVVVIDAENKGGMRLASSPYDRRVAGVIAGANNYGSAITLRAIDAGEGRMPVTLTGTAYCLASNANGAIKAGDLLTTSAVPGHAMKVTDHDAARGAILGKALEDLKGDKGQILILASLQ